jgi:anaerobic selenocysteine-containing dehydrogenase
LDRIVFAVGESNSWGVLDVLGSDVPEAEVECREEDLDTLVVVADDLVRRSPRPGTMAERLSRLANLIVIDRFPTDTTALAHVVLPSCTFAEADAWVTNLFGEARPWRRIVTPPGDAVPERIWIERIEALAPLASRASSPGAPPTPPASARLRPTPASLATMARQAGSTEFPHLLLFSSPAASFSTGVMSSRDEILQREAGEPVVMASPGTLEAAELKPGCAARLVVPGGEATLMVRADRRLPDSVLVLVALPGSTAAGLRGRYPGKAGTVGLQPVPARLERA